jgi:hypothetical protein
MHRALSLYVTHHFAALLQVKFGPVFHVHSQNVTLTQIGLSGRYKFEVALAQQRGRGGLLFGKSFFQCFKRCFECLLLPRSFLRQHLLDLFLCPGGFNTLLPEFLIVSPNYSQLFFLFLCDVFILQVSSILVSQLFALVHDCEEAGHGQSDLHEVAVAVELLLELLADEQIGLQLVLLLEHHVPELVQVVVVLEPQLFRPPRAAGSQVLPLVLLEASQCVQVFDRTRGCLRDRSGRSTIHRLEVVPVDAHIDLY